MFLVDEPKSGEILWNYFVAVTLKRTSRLVGVHKPGGWLVFAEIIQLSTALSNRTLLLGGFLADDDAVLVDFKGFSADSRNLHNVFGFRKRSVGFPVGDDFSGIGRSDTLELGEFLNGCRIDIDLLRLGGPYGAEKNKNSQNCGHDGEASVDSFHVKSPFRCNLRMWLSEFSAA
jgi:hypothetical protein